MKIVGVDFSSAPRLRKPITLTVGRLLERPPLEAGPDILQILEHRRFATLDDFDRWLATPDTWIAGFDFPFGLPRPFLLAQSWGVLAEPAAPQPSWADITANIAALSRPELVDRCRAWTRVRPAGSKFAHRTTDGPSGSSPSMKWVNPPVALMLHAGAPRLLAAGVTVPGLCRGDPARIALEAYPGMLARQVVGRVSYKTDDPRKDGGSRRAAREAITSAIEAGRMGIAVAFSAGLREPCVEDPTADTLDAVLCAVQAAWGWRRRDANFGLPAAMDPLEGWTVGALPIVPIASPAPSAPSGRSAPARTA
jgi:hypothetical protein